MKTAHTRPARKNSIISDINVTPFVDVLLVLLVISIVTLPVVISGIRVHLPEVTTSVPINKTQQTVTLSVTQNQKIFLNDRPVTLAELEGKLRSLRKGAQAPPILLNADASIRYQFLIHLIESLHKAHFYRIGFVTVPKR